MSFKNIFGILGMLIALNGAFMLTAIPFSIYYKEDYFPLLTASLISIILGLSTWATMRMKNKKELSKKEGYLVVALGWVSMSTFGMLPFLLSGSIETIHEAFFETMSGYTTTGASILNDIEAVPKGILFWRSLTQWIGGMGIIVLTIALLPMLGVGGMQLFIAEAPGISPDKLKPRIADTAKRLWLIYLGLTAVETVLLRLGGMNFFDAINHSLTTMATGGFSTKNASMAHYESTPYIQYVVMIFMFLAGVNFTLTYFGLKGRFQKVWKNEEFKTYLFFTVIFSVFTTAGILIFTDSEFEPAFRDATFQVISVITTTGYISADYTSWAPILTVMFFFLMFLGGSAGSTAGGVKIVRHLVMIKNSFLEMKRILHPSAILPVRLNDHAVSQSVTHHVLAFIIVYLSIFVFGSLAVALTGVDFMTTISAVATSLGNVGPGLGSVGPVDNFAHLPMLTKWMLSFLMLIGRLELFTILILFTPYFWKKI
ncbi:TrkH family potassium uptake protein [bacterium SCSIO 12643]|nr:TrkH family potassium uptake protein [bacterium SCSIO 12643]